MSSSVKINPFDDGGEGVPDGNNRESGLDLSDPIWLLSHLLFKDVLTFPCEDSGIESSEA